MCTCILPGKVVPKMTYTVSGGTQNRTHSLIHKSKKQCRKQIQGAAKK